MQFNWQLQQSCDRNYSPTLVTIHFRSAQQNTGIWDKPVHTCVQKCVDRQNMDTDYHFLINDDAVFFYRSVGATAVPCVSLD
jgi:hypothetical protein